MQRREFLKLLSTLPFLNTFNAFSIEAPSKRKYLVLMELKGGNDGLNTVVPYKNKLYYENRPSLQISPDDVLEINSELGFNPALSELQQIYQNNDLSIIQNIGYSNPNKSHFTSLDIWERASYNKNANGWLYELFKNNRSNHLIDAMVFSGSTGLFEGPNPNFLKVNNLRRFVKRARKLKVPTDLSSNPMQTHLLNSIKMIKKVSSRLESEVDFDEMEDIKEGKIGLSDQLLQVNTLIESNVDIPIFKVSIGGLDTHSNQLDTHKKILTELDDSLGEFTKKLKSQGFWNNVLILTYSEFGRRISENGSKGTDHGEASCMFCMGGKVKGGLYGEAPDLLNNHDGNLVSKIDFKEVYAALEKKWFQVNNNVVKDTPLEFL